MSDTTLKSETIPEKVSTLQLFKGQSKIRIINASDTKIEFLLTAGKGTEYDASRIEPSSGYLSARSFLIITINNHRGDLDDVRQLRLTYWKHDKLKKRISIGRLVPIRLIRPEVRSIRQRSYEIVIKALRASFMAALLVYNIYLIIRLMNR